jgi:hypothetical protein
MGLRFLASQGREQARRGVQEARHATQLQPVPVQRRHYFQAEMLDKFASLSLPN